MDSNYNRKAANSSIDVNKMIETFEKASSFDLWRLSVVIDQMLNDPDRVRVIESQLKVNQEITYFDFKENKDVPAAIVEVHRTNVLVKNHHDQKLWTIPFYMLNIGNVRTEICLKRHRVDRFTLKVGDNVGFVNRANKRVYGTVTKLNPKAAEVRLPSGERWRIHYHALFSVLEDERAQGEP